MNNIDLEIGYIEQIYGKIIRNETILPNEKENVLKILDDHEKDCDFKRILSTMHGGNIIRELRSYCGIKR